MTSAPIMPGTQPQRVSKKMIKKEPQPLSMTDSGGKRIANKTRKKLIHSKSIRYSVAWLEFRSSNQKTLAFYLNHALKLSKVDTKAFLKKLKGKPSSLSGTISPSAFKTKLSLKTRATEFIPHFKSNYSKGHNLQL